MSKWQTLREQLGISDKTHQLTLNTREKYFNKVKDNVPLIEGYNYMADLLFLPKTKTFGGGKKKKKEAYSQEKQPREYSILLVMVDLATDAFDIEEIPDKESSSVLDGMLRMFRRPYLSQPKASMRTDEGNEFMGIFTLWLRDHNIIHKRGLVGRHSQQANVERLNRTLGELFMGYLNSVELKTGRPYNEWTDILDEVRRKLNAIRKKAVPENINTYQYPVWNSNNVEPAYEVGDLVYVKLTEPRDALGNRQDTKAFRAGDIRWSREPRRVKQVLYYTGRIPYRYMVSGFPQVSYTEKQMRPAEEDAEELRVVKKIIQEGISNDVPPRKVFKVWYEGELKKGASWQYADDIERYVPFQVEEWEDFKTQTGRKKR